MPAVLAVCERCKRVFYSLPFIETQCGKFCDVPSCRGYLHHIDRTNVRGAPSQTPRDQ